MMIGSEALSTLKYRLSRMTAGSADLDTWIYAELNLAQNRLQAAPELPWFLLTEEAYQEVQYGEERVMLPEDFLRETETDNLQIEDTETANIVDITKTQYDDARRRYGEDLGMPQVYVLSGNYYRLRPIPDKTTYRLWMTYFAKAETVTSAVESSWLKYMPDLLMAEAGIIIAAGLRNEQALALFSGIRKTELNRLVVENVAREMANYQSNPED